MPGEERRQHVRMPTFYAKKTGVQSEMKRGVPRSFPDCGREGLGTELRKPSHFGM